LSVEVAGTQWKIGSRLEPNNCEQSETSKALLFYSLPRPTSLDASKALFTRDILTHNIAIKGYAIKRYF